MAVPKKDPDDVLDYGLNFGQAGNSWLVDGDTITASTWTVVGPDDDLIVDSSSFTATTTTVWLSGGTAGTSTNGKEYRVLNHITTVQGREKDRTLKIKVAQQ